MAADIDGEAGLGVDERGEWTLRDAEAREYVRGAARATVSLVESTYGPRGLEKLVETANHQGVPETVRAGDAGRLFDAVQRGGGFTHPVSALFVDAVDGMQRGLSDGTTAATLLGGALLDEGFDLVEEGVAPGSVVVGYAMARARAGETLDALARPVAVDDEATLRAVAETTMTADLDPAVRRRDAERVVDAVREVAAADERGWVDTDDVKVLAAREAGEEFHRGLVLSRPADAGPNGAGVPEPLTDATVAVLDDDVDFESTASSFGGDAGAGVRLDSADAVADYRRGLEGRIESTATGLAETGVDVLVCMEKLDADVARAFERAGVAVVDKATYPKGDIYRLARATGATVTSNVADLGPDRLGRAGRVVERRVGDEVWTAFEDCSGPLYTIVADADTPEAANRRRESIEDALETTATAAMDGQVLPGACAPAAAVAAALREYAPSVSGTEQLAIEAFADALDRLPYALAANAGLDPIDALTRLRSAHSGGNPGGDAPSEPSALGVDLDTGAPVDAWEAGVVEPRRVFSQAVETGGAVVEQLLTIDAVLYPNVDLPGYTPRTEHE
ncbi:TCP-1/cpn60 chaperonin family protein [Halobium salinum]|uniref:TCP-1/cpn60 chaperonin family protein n=1 Tax=Halobium salinum TaxID=1364940 RepID=A0ABD5PHX5_9EURY|nr:TCP-1/cpn60 chaperonin family protein [Halobium salinum]